MKSLLAMFALWVGLVAYGKSENSAKLVSLSGAEAITFSSLHGEAFVVEFFASWCGSCQSNMLPVMKLTQKESVKYVPVSIDDSLQKAKSFFLKGPEVLKPLEKRAYLDVDGALAKSLGVRGPSIVVFDRHGKVRRVLAGHLVGSELADLETLLKELRSSSEVTSLNSPH